MQAPSRYRRYGLGPDTATPVYQDRLPGGAVPPRIQFNPTRAQRHPPARRRSVEGRNDHRSPADMSTPLQQRSDGPPRGTLPCLSITDRVWDLGLQRLNIRDNAQLPFSSNETLPLPPVRADGCSTPLFFPKPPRTAPERADGEPVPSTWNLQLLTHESPLDHKSQAVDSRLQGAFEPFHISFEPQASPTGRRGRLPSAWVAADSTPTPSLDLPRAYCKPVRASANTATPGFQIPRKPAPKVKAAPRPAPLKLFPATPANNTSPLGSLRSGSTLVGVDVEGGPMTPTTQPLAHKALDGSPASCSPETLAASGWYDEEDGNERLGLMSPRKGRRSFAGFKTVWRGCFGCP